MDQIMREGARLIILKELAGQQDETLAASMLEEVMAGQHYIRRGRAFVLAELDYLAEAGGVSLIAAGEDKVATLTDRGRRHLDRSFTLHGVKRPDRAGP